MSLNESNVRTWLKKAWVTNLQWIEPGHGASVGLPDVLLPLPDYQLPLELKFWQRTRKGIRCDIRPSQRRYHIMAHRNGYRTAFLVGMVLDAQLTLHAFPGLACPLEAYPQKLKLWRVASSADPLEASKQKLIALLENDRFWEI